MGLIIGKHLEMDGRKATELRGDYAGRVAQTSADRGTFLF